MGGYRENGVEWLVESNKKMISDRYGRSESRNTHAQPKGGEEEKGDGGQVATVLKSASTAAAAKADSRRGSIWYSTRSPTRLRMTCPVSSPSIASSTREHAH